MNTEKQKKGINKSNYNLEYNMLKENLKIAKLRADLSKALYEEAYYILQYTEIKNKHPELFEFQQINTNNNENNNQQID